MLGFRVYVGQSGNHSKVERLDVRENRWTQSTPLQSPRPADMGWGGVGGGGPRVVFSKVWGFGFRVV